MYLQQCFLLVAWRGQTGHVLWESWPRRTSLHECSTCLNSTRHRFRAALRHIIIIFMSIRLLYQHGSGRTGTTIPFFQDTFAWNRSRCLLVADSRVRRQHDKVVSQTCLTQQTFTGTNSRTSSGFSGSMSIMAGRSQVFPKCEGFRGMSGL